MSIIGVDRVAGVEAAGSRRQWLYWTGGAAALALLALFLIGAAGIISTLVQTGTAGSWLAALQDNWLVVLFNINAGLAGAQAGSLNLLNYLDMSIMVLFCVMFIALYGALGYTSKIWTAVATVLPFLGIPVFVMTGMAGRSALFFAVLIISAVMLRSNVFGKASAYAGIVASLLLFFGGDIATTIFTSSSVIAVVIGIGYVLWIVWFSLTAARLFQLGR